MVVVVAGWLARVDFVSEREADLLSSSSSSYSIGAARVDGSLLGSRPDPTTRLCAD
jgi:hypothetical protein